MNLGIVTPFQVRAIRDWDNPVSVSAFLSFCPVSGFMSGPQGWIRLILRPRARIISGISKSASTLHGKLAAGQATRGTWVQAWYESGAFLRARDEMASWSREA